MCQLFLLIEIAFSRHVAAAETLFTAVSETWPRVFPAGLERAAGREVLGLFTEIRPGSGSSQAWLLEERKSSN